MNYRARALVALTLIQVSLLGCALPKRIVRETARKGSTLSLNVVMDKTANGGNAIAVDLVVVNDKALLKEIAKLPAAEWFRKRDQYQKDYRDKIQSNYWEWMVGQVVEAQKVRTAPNSAGSVLFASYATDGDHRAELGLTGKWLLSLNNQDFTLQPMR